MADGRDQASDRYRWTEIFRCFQVALDPRKLLVAAAGILAVSVGWYFLSMCFYRSAPVEADYSDLDTLRKTYKGYKTPAGKEFGDDDFRAAGKIDYAKDMAAWRELHALAGHDGGRLRTMPWYEYRGPNPYDGLTKVIAGSAEERKDMVGDFITGSVPTLFEPLVKLLIPILKVFDRDVSPMTRIYLLLCIIWSLACWAFFGGIITRIAAVQLSGKDRISLNQAVQFVANRYTAYLLSPLIPLGAIAFAAVVLALLGIPALVGWLGDLVYLVLVPLGLLGGFVMAMLLIGLLGYPLMYATLSTEGSDTFDALSRAYNYVFTSPWQYFWYCLVAIIYGAIVSFVVLFIGSLAIYLSKWAISQTPANEYFNRRPEYLFVYAPESFGWKEMLLHGSPIEKVQAREANARDPITGRKVYRLENKNPVEAEKYLASYSPANSASAAITTVWLVLVFLLMLGFTYSFFWSAMTMIYLLMRKQVDEIELDEIYLEDEELPPPMAPATLPQTPSGTGTSLPMVPPPPATVPFPTPPATDGKVDDKK
jgi:hypothetical protein